MRALLLLPCILFAACAPTAPESVEMDAPPWGWTEVTADLPASFPELHRTVVATTATARELHVAVEADSLGTTRSVFVTAYERPRGVSRVARWLVHGDVPGAANLASDYRYTRVDPASLSLPVGLEGASAAWQVDNPEKGESGTVVQRCEGDLCIEALVAGQGRGHHADLLPALTIRR